MATQLEKQMDILIGISVRMEKSLQILSSKSSMQRDSSEQPDSTDDSSSIGKLASLATSIFSIVKAISDENYKPKNANSLVNFISSMNRVSQDIKIDSIKALTLFTDSFSKFIEVLGNFSITKALKIRLYAWLLFDKKDSALKKIITGSIDLVKGIKKDQLERFELLSTSLSEFANGLEIFIKSLGKLALVGIAYPLIMLGSLAMRSVLEVFLGMSKKYDDIKKGGEALSTIGKGIMIFSASLAVMSLALILIPPKIILESFAVLGGMALIFHLLGKASKDIAKGAEVMIFGMSLGLFFFSGALLLMAFAIEKAGLLNLMGGIALFYGFSYLFVTLGKQMSSIQKGALVFASMGIALIAFSVGLLVLGFAMKTIIQNFSNDYLTAGLATAAIIGGITLLFAGAGLMAPAILFGSAAIVTVGIALISFSVGLLTFSLAYSTMLSLFKGDWKKAAEGMSSVITSISLAFAGIGLSAIPALLGAGAVVAIGISLIALSVGVMLFSTTSYFILKSNVLYDDKADDKKNYKYKPMNIITSIMSGFASIWWKSIKALPGIAASVLMSISLVTISIGIGAAALAVKSISRPQEFVKTLFGSKQNPGIIWALISTFSDIAKEIGGFNVSKGNDKASIGARAVSTMGDALKSIAGGIAAFASFEKFPVEIIDSSGKKISSNVNMFDVMDKLKVGLPPLLFSLADVFSSIGQSKIFPSIKEGKGNIFTRLLSLITSDDSVSKGVKSVAGLGAALQSIAGGISAFANFDMFPIEIVDESGNKKWKNVKIADMINNVRAVLLPKDIKGGKQGLLTVLADVFADIGKKYGDKGFFGNKDTKKGAEAVQQIGDAMNGLSSFISTFADIESKGIPTSFDKNGKPIKFSKVKISEMMSGIATSLKSFIETLSRTSLENKLVNTLQKLAEVFKMFGDSSSGFSAFVKSFDSFQQPFSIFSSTMGTFSVNFEKFSKQLTNYRSFIDKTNSLASFSSQYAIFSQSFSRVSGDMKIFAENFKKMDSETIVAFRYWSDSFSSLLRLDSKSFSEFRESAKMIKDAVLSVAPKTEIIKQPIAAPVAPIKISESAKNTVIREDPRLDSLMLSVNMLSEKIDMLVSTLSGENGIKVRFQ